MYYLIIIYNLLFPFSPALRIPWQESRDQWPRRGFVLVLLGSNWSARDALPHQPHRWSHGTRGQFQHFPVSSDLSTSVQQRL